MVKCQSRFIELFGGEKYAKKPIRELVDRKIASARKTYGCDETIHYIDISSIDNKANMVTGTTEYIMADAPSRAQQCIQYGDILISTVRPNLRNIARNDYSGDKYKEAIKYRDEMYTKVSKCLFGEK